MVAGTRALYLPTSKEGIHLLPPGILEDTRAYRLTDVLQLACQEHWHFGRCRERRAVPMAREEELDHAAHRPRSRP